MLRGIHQQCDSGSQSVKKEMTFTQSILKLIGHLVGSAIMFMTLFVLAWSISYWIHELKEVHELHANSQALISNFEFFFLVFDSVLCSIVIFIGAIRFIKEIR